MSMLPAAVADLAREPGEMVVETETQISWLSPERLKTDDSIPLSHPLINVQSRELIKILQIYRLYVSRDFC